MPRLALLCVSLVVVGCQEAVPVDAPAEVVVVVPSDAGTPRPAVGAEATITIRSFTFAPTELFVSPGDDVTIENLDGEAHTLTSEAAPGTYVWGQVNGVSFNTPPFTGTLTLHIPDDAPRGTVLSYFCALHQGRERNLPRITVR